MSPDIDAKTLRWCAEQLAEFADTTDAVLEEAAEALARQDPTRLHLEGKAAGARFHSQRWLAICEYIDAGDDPETAEIRAKVDRLVRRTAAAE